MIRPKHFLAFAAALLPAAVALAQSSSDAVTVTALPSWISQYYFRGRHDSGAAFQPDIEADYRGFTVGVWANFPETRTPPAIIGNPSRPSDPEIDYYASYTWSVSGPWSIQPGLTVYTLPRAVLPGIATEKGATPGYYRSTYEPSLAVNYTIAGVRFTPKACYDLTSETLTGEIGGAFALPLRAIGSELDWNGTVGIFYSRRPINPPPSPSVAYYTTSTSYETVEVQSFTHQTLGYWSTQVSLPYRLPQSLRATFALGAAGSLGGTLVTGSTPPIFFPAYRSTTSATAQGYFSVSFAYVF